MDDLKEKRDELVRKIQKDEEERQKVQIEMANLNKRLGQVNESLTKKTSSKEEYDKTIQDTEDAYVRILETSQNLLSHLKREKVTINKKRQASQ